MNEHWQPVAERVGGQPMVALLTEMRDNQLDMRGDFEQLSKRVMELQASTDLVRSGFPANDVEGHRRYHQSVIEARELRNKLVRAALEKAIGSGAVIGTGWVLLAVWEYFKIKVGK